MATRRQAREEAAMEVDPQQKEKFEDILELLLAAGYFRVRIQGLSPFDKVVGGLAWCISSSNVDVEVDVSFQENANIGYKIKIGENIVKALKRMDCPFPLQSHQIQGQDYARIFPVIQWLVKRVMETREEMGDAIRRYSELLFDRSSHDATSTAAPEAVEAVQAQQQAAVVETAIISKSIDKNRPQRRFRRSTQVASQTEEARVQATLLEYGRLTKASSSAAASSGGGRKNDMKSPSHQQMQREKEEKDAAAEEEQIQSIMQSLNAVASEDVRISSANVGRIVGLQSDRIAQIVNNYMEQASALEAEAESQTGRGGNEVHRRLVTAMNRQISTQESKLKKVKESFSEMETKLTTAQTEYARLMRYNARAESEIAKVNALEEGDEAGDLAKLRGLVSLNERLEREASEFRSSCKQQVREWNESIDALQRELTEGQEGEEHREIEAAYQADVAKKQRLQMLLSKRARDMAMLQRRIDDVPTRGELIQYERRFGELYEQVTAKLEETRKFFNTYNTLEETRNFLAKGLSIFNSVHDKFEASMANKATKEGFVGSLQRILESVQNSRAKVEQKLKDEQAKRDTLNEELATLVGKQRFYFQSVKQFQEECKLNETLKSSME